MAKYEVVAVNRVTGQEIRKGFDSAPSSERIACWLERRGSIGGTRHVNQWVAARYFPSKKGWMILDYEHAVPRPLRSRPGITVWAQINRGKKIYPSEAAALMKISYLLAMPEQLKLIL